MYTYSSVSLSADMLCLPVSLFGGPFLVVARSVRQSACQSRCLGDNFLSRRLKPSFKQTTSSFRNACSGAGVYALY